MVSFSAYDEGDLGLIGIAADLSGSSSNSGELLADCQLYPYQEEEWADLTTCAYCPSLTPSLNMMIFAGLAFWLAINVSRWVLTIPVIPSMISLTCQLDDVTEED